MRKDETSARKKVSCVKNDEEESLRYTKYTPLIKSYVKMCLV